MHGNTKLKKKNKTPLIRTLAIRIGLALRVNIFLLELYCIFLWLKSSPDCQIHIRNCVCVCVFCGKRLSRKSNNVVVFPFAFHIAVQQSFLSLWSRLLLYGPKPSQVPFALRLKSLLMSLCPASEGFYRSSLLLGICLRLVPTPLTCPAWETLLVAVLPPG